MCEQRLFKIACSLYPYCLQVLSFIGNNPALGRTYACKEKEKKQKGNITERTILCMIECKPVFSFSFSLFPFHMHPPLIWIMTYRT
jgi:hypothetical protein